MNEKQKLYVIIAFVVVIIAIILGTVIVKSNAGKQVIKNFDAALASNENKAIYIMRTGCSWCGIFDPQVAEMEQKYGAEILKIDTNDITSSQFSYILEKLQLDEETFGTPYMVIVKDGKKVAELPGYDTTDSLFAFLQKNGFIAADKKLPLNYINYEDYKKLIESKEKEIIVFGQTGCSACIAATPYLDEIAEEYKVKINYFNITKLSETEKQEFEKSLSYLTEKEWGTPLMLIVQDKKVIADSPGFYNKDTYVKFLTTNGFIK